MTQRKYVFSLLKQNPVDRCIRYASLKTMFKHICLETRASRWLTKVSVCRHFQKAKYTAVHVEFDVEIEHHKILSPAGKIQKT